MLIFMCFRCADVVFLFVSLRRSPSSHVYVRLQCVHHVYSSSRTKKKSHFSPGFERKLILVASICAEIVHKQITIDAIVANGASHDKAPPAKLRYSIDREEAQVDSKRMSECVTSFKLFNRSSCGILPRSK